MARARWPLWLAGALWALTLLGLAATLWLDRLLRQTGYPELAYLWGTGNLPLLVAAVSAATVGAVVVGRRPAHRVGWLLVLLGLLIAAAGFTFSYSRYGLVARPGALPAADYLAGYATAGVFTYLSCLGFILLLTPTGSLPSPRWRWWARVAAAGLVVAFLTATASPRPLYPEYPDIGNPLGVAALKDGPLALLFPLGALVILAALVVGAVSLLLRFRRARGVERQQLRWVALGAALAAVAFLVALTTLVVDGDDTLFQVALGISVTVLPLATGAAILRYRLYDIDRIVSRTVAYGLLTLLLGLGYAAVVLGLGRLLPEGSTLVVAGATLAVAAVFSPLRRRVQDLVDRRFNRRRHDAAQTIAAFSARLRDQVDLDTLSVELVTLVDQTMQPTQASLWLRPQPKEEA
jgi:N-terminal 7TM region of histidine kinase